MAGRNAHFQNEEETGAAGVDGDGGHFNITADYQFVKIA
jgi:hypothetical protein